MKILKSTFLLAILLLLPVTIFASKSITDDCEKGFNKNNLGICEEIKAPQNGKLNSYKDDFECDREYRKNKQNWSCDQIKLPENGILTVAGNDWTCISQYKRAGDKCEKVTLPENAKFHIQGSDWYCNHSYEKQNDQCVKLELPSNAHWNYDGNDWECNKGFKESEDGKSCITVKVPNDAQPNYIGTFTCNSGFKQVGDEQSSPEGKCEKEPDIENGKFYTTGADFYCAKGFKKNESERKCEKIKIPENAHEDNLALEGWSCNREYKKQGSECKKFTLPEHAFYSENTWKCELGYRKNPTPDSCNKIHLPENAHYIETYDGWFCNNGYTKNYKENRCDKS